MVFIRIGIEFEKLNNCSWKFGQSLKGLWTNENEEFSSSLNSKFVAIRKWKGRASELI